LIRRVFMVSHVQIETCSLNAVVTLLHRWSPLDSLVWRKYRLLFRAPFSVSSTELTMANSPPCSLQIGLSVFSPADLKYQLTKPWKHLNGTGVCIRYEYRFGVSSKTSFQGLGDLGRITACNSTYPISYTGFYSSAPSGRAQDTGLTRILRL
jgi:hypothetical protein